MSSMTLSMEAVPVPLTMNKDGVVRVGKTRVTLDSVISAFLQGAAPEEIAYQYPSLQLADIYAVVSYYLHHEGEVKAYLEQRKKFAAEVQQQNEARFPSQGIRERLLARRAKS